MIKQEVEIIRQSRTMDMSNYNHVMIAATKNTIIRFMKNQLKMDEKTRNSVTIKEIYPSRSETNAIVYIKCQSQEDIATITNHAKNLQKPIIGDTPPTIVRHVPKEFFKRYQALEKLLWQIRKTKQNQVLTNIRLGRRDYIIRYKNKDDPTKWNNITPMSIPKNIPKPEIKDNLLKTNQTPKPNTTPYQPEQIPKPTKPQPQPTPTTNSHQPQQTPPTQTNTQNLNQTTNSNQMEVSDTTTIPTLESNFTITPLSPETNKRIQRIQEQTGTISYDLKNKHKSSPTEFNQENKKKQK